MAKKFPEGHFTVAPDGDAQSTHYLRTSPITTSFDRTAAGYQFMSRKYKTYKDTSSYPFFALIEEVGELYRHFAKLEREDYPCEDLDTQQKVRDELGDIFWNLARIADKYEISLGDVVQENLDKLEKRFQEGRIKTDRNEKYRDEQ